jgi:hypothetical protein
MTRERVARFSSEDWRRNLPNFQEPLLFPSSLVQVDNCAGCKVNCDVTTTTERSMSVVAIRQSCDWLFSKYFLRWTFIVGEPSED